MTRRGKRSIRKRKVVGSGLVNSIINRLPVEFHIPGYQFCGPGTNLEKRLARGDSGINPLDALCKEHDIAYATHTDLAERHRADRILYEGAKARISAPDAKFGERSAARLIKTIIGAKMTMGAGVRKKRGKKRKTGAGLSKRKRKCGSGCKRKRGGFVLPALATALTAYKTYRDISNAKKMLNEQQKHHRQMQEIAKGKGLYLKPYGSGLKRKRRRRKNFFPIARPQI